MNWHRALAGRDYVARTGLIEWQEGEQHPMTITITTLDDHYAENFFGTEQWFVVNLFNPVNGFIERLSYPYQYQASVKIIDDDPTSSLINFSDGQFINQRGQKGFPNADFAGNISVVDQFGMSVTATSQQEITVTANIDVDPQHLGQTADLLFVIAREPPSASSGYQANEDTIYYTIDQHNQQKIVDLYADYTIWIPQFDAPFRSEVTLENTISMVWWQGKLEGPAKYYFFVGYRLADGTIVYNSRPLTVEII